MEQGDEGQVERALRAVPKAGKGFAAVTQSKAQAPGSGQGGDAIAALFHPHRTVVLRLDSAICQISHDARKGRIDPW